MSKPTRSSFGSTMLEARQVRKRYKSGTATLEVLRGVDFELTRGGFTAVVGQSGSGKSTLLHLLGLLDAPDGGEVLLEGRRIDNLPAIERDRLRNTAIGMVFQAYHLLPELTAVENVLTPLLIRHGIWDWFRRRREARREAEELLDRFGLAGRLHHRPRQLSGGEMQRVAIARALITRPQVLLADEPTGNLDSRSTADVLDLLDEIHAEGKTIVIITHEDDVAERAGRVVTLRDGKVESDVLAAAR